MATLLLLRPVTGARYNDNQVQVVVLHGDYEITKFDKERLVAQYPIADELATLPLDQWINCWRPRDGNEIVFR